MQLIIKTFILSIFTLPTFLFGQINNNVYKALQSNNLNQIEKQIEILNKEKVSSTNNAYLGALYMKKSDYLKDVKVKISTFKKGKVLLEKEIENLSENIEFIFLRLAIQEHAPKILKYNIDLESDKSKIKASFDKLPSDLKNIIKEYSTTSSQLNL